MPRSTRAELAPIFRDPKTLRAAEEVINGALVGGAVETGASVPTIGANKPGSLAGAPVAWVPVVHDGIEYLMPLWRRD